MHFISCEALLGLLGESECCAGAKMNKVTQAGGRLTKKPDPCHRGIQEQNAACSGQL